MPPKPTSSGKEAKQYGRGLLGKRRNSQATITPIAADEQGPVRAKQKNQGGPSVKEEPQDAEKPIVKQKTKQLNPAAVWFMFVSSLGS